MDPLIFFSWISIIISFGITTETKEGNGCSINLDTRTGKYVPFILSGNNHEIIYPTKSRNLEFANDETIILHCHGSRMKRSVRYSFASGKEMLPFTCADGKWMNGEDSVDVAIIECKSIMFPVVKRQNEACSPIGGDGRTTQLESLVLVELGFNFTSSYSPLITLCHDENNYATIWSRHRILGKSIGLSDGTSYRPSFRTNVGGSRDFYPFTTQTKMRSHYSKSSQYRTIMKLLGKNTILVDGKKVPIIDKSRSGTHYLAKGHLSPDASFVYIPEQDGTYFYFNAAPQFQSFNNRNWKSIEFKARNWAEKQAIELTVYTGTFGILQFPNKAKDLLNISLFPKTGNVPAPEYYWKVLYDSKSNEAIALIGLNNPFQRKAPENICTNICDQTEFGDPDYLTFEAGYTLCCEVSELRQNVSSIPDLSVGGVWPSLMGKKKVTPAPVIQKGCQIILDNLHKKYPPIFASQDDFIYPSFINEKDERITVIPEGTQAVMFCQRSRGIALIRDGETSSSIKSLSLNCKEELLTHDGEIIDPYTYRCNYLNQPILNIERQAKCSTEGVDKRTTELNWLTSISLGWELEVGFKEQIYMCVDEKFYGTLWTRHVVNGEHIEFQDKEMGRIGFRVDETGKKRLFGGRSTSKVNRAYSKSSQKAAVEALTGHMEIHGEEIIETGKRSTVFLARGHLSPDAGFVNYAQQLGTYFFVNVAPQFQSFNNGNWKALEVAVRDLAEKNKSDLEVTTGTYDILTYYGAKIFLLEEKIIPVPLYFWKVVYHQPSDKAVAFIAYNDIHSKTTPAPLCESVCDQLQWVDWELQSIEKGFMYCCRVEDLRKAISYAPDIQADLLDELY